MYNIQPDIIWQNEYPTLITIPTVHQESRILRK